MKRLLLTITILAALFPAADARMTTVVVGGGVSGATDYCSTQTWNTLTNFRLDFDHTTDTKTACLSSGTQVGELTGSPSITNPSPTTAGIGSGGNGLICDAAAEYINFDNNSNIFISKWGTLGFKVKLSGDNTTDHNLFSIIKTAYQDRIGISLLSTGRIQALWEDNDHGSIALYDAAIDLDSYYGDWAEYQLRWDTTRCTDGTCDGAGEDEMCMRLRVDANNDGDFNDGGAETWTGWICETSAIDMGEWLAEPTTNTIDVGIINGTFSYEIDFDDIEISNSQPAW